jgi:hypothetical protein
MCGMDVLEVPFPKGALNSDEVETAVPLGTVEEVVLDSVVQLPLP